MSTKKKHLYLAAAVIKGCQLDESLGFCVECSDGLQDVHTFAPVHLLQIVGGQLVDLRIARDGCELNDCLRITCNKRNEEKSKL